MKSVAAENLVSREKTAEAPAAGVVHANSAAPDAAEPVRLDISWHVAPAQIVAILDLTDKGGDQGLSRMTAAAGSALANRKFL